MKKNTAFFMALLCIAALFSGCRQTGSAPEPAPHNTYTGTVESRNNQEADGVLSDCLKVDVGEGRSLLCTITENTQIINADTISAGDKVEIVCESLSSAGYAHALTIEVKEAAPLARMIMVDGEIYIEAGVSDISPSCGVMDGEITSTVEANEIPRQNNTSNFGKAYEYQFAGEGQINIFIGDEWIQFKKAAAGA